MSNTNWPRRGRGPNAGEPAKGSGRFATTLGFGICALIVIWAIWHGVVGPRVIAPVPGTPIEAAETP